jgi:hypothetical protein
MRTIIKKTFIFIVVLLPAFFCVANNSIQVVNNSIQKEIHPVVIKAGAAVSSPKTSSIQATIDGHSLTVVFLENLGTVHIEVTDLNGGAVALTDLYTPNGYIAYIYNTGSYIVTFTLTNGDEYYGEFDVTD